jgi:hypothetical protein
LPGAPQYFTSEIAFLGLKNCSLRFFVTFLLWPNLQNVECIHTAIAEDDPCDRMWLKTVLDKLGINYRLTIAEDGEQARDSSSSMANIQHFHLPTLSFST